MSPVYTNPADSQWRPSDHGLISWSHDPSVSNGATILPAGGTINFARLKLATPASITTIRMSVTTAGGTLTAGQCFAALYQGTSLVGSTADQAAAWVSAGTKSMALVGGPFAVTAGDVIVAFYAVGTTMPTFLRGAAVATVGQSSANLSGASSRFGTADTGLTTAMPGTLGALTASVNGWWVAVL